MSCALNLENSFAVSYSKTFRGFKFDIRMCHNSKELFDGDFQNLPLAEQLDFLEAHYLHFMQVPPGHYLSPRIFLTIPSQDTRRVIDYHI